MSTKITISKVSGADLFVQYPGQTQRQPCFVELDARTGALSAEANTEIGNAVPEPVWAGHRTRWTLPQPLRARAANALLAQIAPLAERMCSGYSSEHDGRNTVAVYTSDAAEASEEISVLCERSCGADDALVVWEASDWFGGLGSETTQARELGITASSTDEELEAIASRETKAAQSDDVDELNGLDKHLRMLRDVMAEEAA